MIGSYAARRNSSPSPLVGEGWGGGASVSWLLTPTLTLPIEGEGITTLPVSFQSFPPTWGRAGIKPTNPLSGCTLRKTARAALLNGRAGARYPWDGAGR